jgi:hypothetical protein
MFTIFLSRLGESYTDADRSKAHSKREISSKISVLFKILHVLLKEFNHAQKTQVKYWEICRVNNSLTAWHPPCLGDVHAFSSRPFHANW